jgi:hypothetical protein
LEFFYKRWGKNHVICVREGRFIKWSYDSPHRGFISYIYLNACRCSPMVGSFVVPFSSQWISSFVTKIKILIFFKNQACFNSTVCGLI